MTRAAFIADIALLVGLSGPGARAPEPYVPPLADVQDVLRVLQAPKARNNPPYVISVLKSYVRPRVARRRSKLQEDLLYLASECPEFASEFRAILKHYRLPLPPELLNYSLHPGCAWPTYAGQSQSPYSSSFAASSCGTYPTYPHLLQSPYASSFVSSPASASPFRTFPRRAHRSRSSVNLAMSTMNVNMSVNRVERVVSPSADPPPPYASEDPDPNTTAVQALRLAAQSRIGLGDLAALAERSRVDLVQIAAESQADLSRLAAGTEDVMARRGEAYRGASTGASRDPSRQPSRAPSRAPSPSAAAILARREALRRLEGTPPPRPPRAPTRDRERERDRDTAARLSLQQRLERRCGVPAAETPPRPPQSGTVAAPAPAPGHAPTSAPVSASGQAYAPFSADGQAAAPVLAPHSPAGRDRTSTSSFASLAVRRLSQLRHLAPSPRTPLSSRPSRPRPASIATSPSPSAPVTAPTSPARHKFSLSFSPQPPTAPASPARHRFSLSFQPDTACASPTPASPARRRFSFQLRSASASPAPASPRFSFHPSTTASAPVLPPLPPLTPLGQLDLDLDSDLDFEHYERQFAHLVRADRDANGFTRGSRGRSMIVERAYSRLGEDLETASVMATEG